jgi:hypothetical protein
MQSINKRDDYNVLINTQLPKELVNKIISLVVELEYSEKILKKKKKVCKELIRHIIWNVSKQRILRTKKYYEKLENHFELNELEMFNQMCFNCNCCRKHQNNKAHLKNGKLQIVTKDNYFDPSFKWKGTYREELYEPYNEGSCTCACRKMSRNHARYFLYNKYGSEAIMGDKRSLGIKLSKETQEHIIMNEMYHINY